jgi:hypothetical protein
MNLIFDLCSKHNDFFSLPPSLHTLPLKSTHNFFCIIGRRKPANIRPRGEGVYVAEFTPQAEGSHRIDINWSDRAIRQR